MPLVLPALVLLTLVSPAGGPDAAAAPPDSTRVPRRVVRQFPAIEVRAPLHDLRSSQTVRQVSGQALRALPVDGLVDAFARLPGVVAQDGELHVRGGRSGETATLLDGLSLNEPLRRRSLSVPLLAVRSADLVSGAPEAQYGSGLAGTLDLRTVEPTTRFSGEWRWQTAAWDSAYDRMSARVSFPLPRLGFGVVAAGDAVLDDRWFPVVRSATTCRLAGRDLFDWRADNHLLGFVKLAPTDGSRRLVAQVLVNRLLSRPYDPAWTLDGWTAPPLTAPPVFSREALPGTVRYRAADHLAVTDEHQLAAQLSTSAGTARHHGTLALGWLRTRSVTSRDGQRGAGYLHDGHRVYYGDRDPFHVIWGDYPLYREAGADAVTLRADGEMIRRGDGFLKAGLGAMLERATLFELDGTQMGLSLDSLRTYEASAPGAYAYVQNRWSFQGLILNTGLRVEYFTAGVSGRDQQLPWDGHGTWSLSPRLGIAYPLSPRDVFSLAYVRVQQSPGRDHLYDTRRLISNRQPLGNPSLQPATVVSYEAAVKHLFGPTWALQSALFYRDVWGLVGARHRRIGGASSTTYVPYYTNDDVAAAVGTEWSLLHVSDAGRRLELHYTWMQVFGSESRPEGDPYGAFLGWRNPSLSSTPLSWDRRHTAVLSAACPLGEGWSVSWSTVVGSPLPWTPKPLREDQYAEPIHVNSRRFRWSESTSLDVRWTPRLTPWLRLSLEARNLFDSRGERLSTVDGYPNPAINTMYDDYAAYRTLTGNGGGAYWVETEYPFGYWVPVGDPRLYEPPRSMRLGVGVTW